MKKQPHRKAFSINELSPDEVLAHWLAAVSTLQRHYSALSNHITQNGDQQNDLAVDQPIGQCTRQQLMAIVNKLHIELASLIQDMKSVQQPAFDRQSFEKLATHTQKLEDLNRQAQVMLHLAELPAS